MHAITYSAFGGSDTLEVSERPEPEPGDGEVLVAIEYAAVNPLDWKIREGLMQGAMPCEFPVIPGCDAAGTVAGVGSGVDNFGPGDRVFCYTRGEVIHDGTYAEMIAVPEQALAMVPDGMELSAAAAVPVASLTAWYALHEFAQLQAGETVLITAGAGGVGSFAIQLAKHVGATVIATASAANHDYMRALGADHCIDYKTQNVPDAVRAIVPEGCPVVFDCAGFTAYEEGYDSLAPGGRIATIVVPPDVEKAEAAGHRAAFIGSRPDGAQLAEIAALFASGVLTVPELHIRSVKDAAKAQDDSQAGHTRGKLVLKIDF